MSSALVAFLRRHQYKLLALGGVSGCVVASKWYAETRLRGWSDGETRRVVQQMQRQTHFESTCARSNSSRDLLVARLLSSLARWLDTDGLLEALRAGVSDRLQVWRELKRRALCRALGSVYGGVMLVVVLEVQVHAISGCLYMDGRRRSAEGSAAQQLSAADEQCCLTHVEYFLSDGLQRLLHDMANVLNPIADSLVLKECLSLQQVDTLLLRTHSALQSSGIRAISYMLPPSLQRTDNNQQMSVTQSQPINSGPNRADSSVLSSGQSESSSCQDSQQLRSEICDVLGTGEVDELVSECVMLCVGRLLDRLAPSFTAASDQPVSPHTLTLHVAKLVPLLTDVPHIMLGREPDSLTRSIANHRRFQTLAANVYESFSQFD